MLAVTTRNRLRSPRFCLPMLLARREIARQLAQQPGLLRYASGLSSPTEFLTLTVWESRESMQRFMQSGAHERHMWQFTRWTSSFWGMRWEPVPGAEIGTWSDRPLAQQTPTPAPVSPLVSAGLLPASVPRAGPLGPRPVGGPGIEPRAAQLVAVTARFEGASAVQRTWRARRGLRTEQHVSGKLVRWSVGADIPPQGLVISLWRDEPRVREDALGVLTGQLRANWAMCWRPADYEIGHWDGLRLRNFSRGRSSARVVSDQ